MKEGSSDVESGWEVRTRETRASRARRRIGSLKERKALGIVEEKGARRKDV
jgi:hypothetical protein